MNRVTEPCQHLKTVGASVYVSGSWSENRTPENTCHTSASEPSKVLAMANQEDLETKSRNNYQEKLGGSKKSKRTRKANSSRSTQQNLQYHV